jgi:hypothetical protein
MWWRIRFERENSQIYELLGLRAHMLPMSLVVATVAALLEIGWSATYGLKPVMFTRGVEAFVTRLYISTKSSELRAMEL